MRDKKLLEFWTRRKEPKTDPLSNPVQHMSLQPLTDIQSQAASTTMNLIQKIYIPVLLIFLIKKKNKQQLLSQKQNRKFTARRFKLWDTL